MTSIEVTYTSRATNRSSCSERVPRYVLCDQHAYFRRELIHVYQHIYCCSLICDTLFTTSALPCRPMHRCHSAKSLKTHGYRGTDGARKARYLRTGCIRSLRPSFHFRRIFGIRRTGERTFRYDSSQKTQTRASYSRVRVDPLGFPSLPAASRGCACVVSGLEIVPACGAFRAAYARSRAACIMLKVTTDQ